MGSVLQVVYLTGGLEQGGAEKQVVLHALGQAELGNRVVVLSVNGGPRVDDLLRLGLDVRVMPNARPVHDLRWMAEVSRWVDDVVRGLDPQVLHGFLPRPSLAATLVGHRRDVPVTVVGRRSLGHHAVEHPWIDRAERYFTRFATCVITNSDAIADVVVARREVATERVHVVPNAIERLWLGAPVERVPGTQWRLVTVANLRPVKGLSTLVDALDQVARHGVDFTWTLVGDGPLRGQLQDAASRRPWMTVTGSLRSPEVLQRLDAADVYVGSSRSEGMSNSIMEALCRRLMVVATDVGSTRELVGAAGVLVPRDRADLLADALLLVLRSADLQQRLRAAAVVQSQTFLSPLDVAIQLDDIYRRYLWSRRS